MDLDSAIKNVQPRAIDFRHRLHQIPELLFEEHGQSVRHCCPAERVIVDVSSVSPQQGLMSQEPVLPLIYRNAEPVAGADRGLDLEQ